MRCTVSPNPPPSAAPPVWQDLTELHPRPNANVASDGRTTPTRESYHVKNISKNKKHKKHTKLDTHHSKRQNVQIKNCQGRNFIGTTNPVVGYSTWYTCQALFCARIGGVAFLLQCCFSGPGFIGPPKSYAKTIPKQLSHGSCKAVSILFISKFSSAVSKATSRAASPVLPPLPFSKARSSCSKRSADAGGTCQWFYSSSHVLKLKNGWGKNPPRLDLTNAWIILHWSMTRMTIGDSRREGG